MEKLLIIDSNAIIHRAYHAYPPNLKTREGVLTNAAYGFSVILLETIAKFQPDYVICAFDAGKKVFRHEKFADYKAHRKPMDPELREQFPIVKEIVTALNIPLLSLEGYEADDLIGSVVKDGIAKGVEKIVVSGDQDLVQLVSKDQDIKLYLAGSVYSASKLLDEDEVVKKYGFSPLQMIDYKAIRGDTSDNIPGIPGIGQKGAEVLIEKFKTIQKIYDSLEAGDPVWQEDKALKKLTGKLTKGKESAFLSYELATIATDIKLNYDLKAATTKEFDLVGAKAVFKRLEFNSLLPRLDKLAGRQDQDSGKASGQAAGLTSGGALDLAAAGSGKPGQPGQSDQSGQPGRADQQGLLSSDSLDSPDYHVLTRVEDALAALEPMLAAEEIVFDTETDGRHYMEAKMLGLGIAGLPREELPGKPNGAGDVKFFYLPSSLCADEKVEKLLKLLFFGLINDNYVSEVSLKSSTWSSIAAESKKLKTRTYIAHNIKYDIHILITAGILPPVIDFPLNTSNCFDTMLAAYLLNRGYNPVGLGLKQLALEKFGMEMHTLAGLLADEGLTFKKSVDWEKLDQIPTEKMGKYCCRDCDATLRLYQLFKKDLTVQKPLQKLFEEVEMPLIGVIMGMEREGIFLDEKYVTDLSKLVEKMIFDLHDKINKVAEGEINVNSPKQIGELLFGKLKIHEILGWQPNKTKTGSYSTDERTLMNYAGKVEIVSDILKYREYAKLKSTYIDALPKQILTTTGKIHTSYNQAIAATGRLSSVDPNLQNIPISSDEGRKIRKGFSAGADRKLLAFDYAQQELRILAHFSEEEKLINAFSEGVDIHSLTASQLLGKGINEISKEDRRTGKTVNFGIVYGISAFGLADRLKIEQKIASEFIKKFFANFPKIQEFFARVKKEGMEKGYVETLLGRRRDAASLAAKNFVQRAAAERELTNFPLQGSAADIMKMGMLAVSEYVYRYNKDLEEGEKLKMHLQVHDELVLSFPKDYSGEKLSKICREISKLMSEAVKIKVPLDVDCEVGENWYEMTPVGD